MTCALEPRRFGKALDAGADIGTIDLEDSVPLGAKDNARRLALPYFAGKPRDNFMRALRINSMRTEHGLRDILALLESGVRPDALMVPKVESAQDLLILEQLLGERLASVGFLVIIETAAGLYAVDEIAAATKRVRAVVFGSADFASDIGISMDCENITYARTRIVLAACRARVPALDTPCFQVRSEARLESEIQVAKRLGFAGKVAIHPRQVAAINEGFSPPAQVVANARRILAECEDNRGHICVIDGQMIGPPAVQTARRVLAIAGKLAS
ncbi:MAG: CoA ester lyase [Acidobacteriota bacterium]|nr:CoA ester lyase [Acidobacteriota bacterium]